MQKWICALAACVLVGCSDESGPAKYLLPVLAENGQTELKEVVIETLSDPYTVSGPAAHVMYNPRFTDYGIDGRPAQPRLAKSGDLFIPMDIASSQSLSVYSTFEQIKKFEDRVLPESLITWPRTVGLELLFSGGRAVNNAFYTHVFDFIGILPYSSGSLPLSYNSGILAHEHFHAHFASLIMKHYKTAFPDQATSDHQSVLMARCGFREDIVYTRDLKQRIVNDMILRGWNEGFADLYAYLVSGNANFFDVSLLGEDRDVTKSTKRLETRFDLERYLESDLNSYGPGCEIGKQAYALGTQIARTMVTRMQSGEFDSFEADKNWTREERTLRFVFSKLKELSASMYGKSLDSTLEPSYILNLMSLKSVPELP